QVICERSWNPAMDSFVATMEGKTLDASLLRLGELGFLAEDDPRFAGTVRAIERELRRGDFVFRYVEADDFGKPENAFLVCTFWYINALAALGRREEARDLNVQTRNAFSGFTFWYINALAALGRREEARDLFETVLACRNRHGLLAEHIDPRTREQWGNFVQTYSMVGLIGSAIRLSVRWDQAF